MLFRGPGAGYGAAMRLMWETSHPLSFAVAGYALAASIMPNLVLIAAGHLVGSIPAASASGLGSAAGACACYDGGFVRGGSAVPDRAYPARLPRSAGSNTNTGTNLHDR